MVKKNKNNKKIGNKNNNKNSNLKQASGKLEITIPRERKGFFVDIKDWEYLKKLVKKPIKKIKWIEIAIGLFGAMTLSSLFYFLTFPIEQRDYRYVPLLVFIFCFLITLILIFFEIRDRKSTVYQSEKEVLDYMRKMEIREIEEKKDKD